MTVDNKTEFEIVSDFENLYKAYKHSKSGKKLNREKIKFQEMALDGLYQLSRLLDTKNYVVSPYKQFQVYEPKRRLIEAGSFKDQIVQHSLCDNILIPKLTTEFINTNYAGQIDKGTLYGLDCLKAHMQLANAKYGKDCWIVKADITKYFYRINHDILKDILGYFFDDEDILWLCEKFIDSKEELGLPLGNQISQVFALLYLSGLDHLVTGELGVRYYGRYMDDFYLIVESKEYAKYCLDVIQNFIGGLELELNGKTQIIPFKNGIRFCGFHTYVTQEDKVIRKLTSEKKRAAKKKYKKMAMLVKRGKLNKEKFLESYDSWKNHISQGNCVKLGYEMDRYIQGLF